MNEQQRDSHAAQAVERERFEAWLLNEGFHRHDFIRNGDDCYADHVVYSLWRGWQASRAESRTAEQGAVGEVYAWGHSDDDGIKDQLAIRWKDETHPVAGTKLYLAPPTVAAEQGAVAWIQPASLHSLKRGSGIATVKSHASYEHSEPLFDVAPPTVVAATRAAFEKAAQHCEAQADDPKRFAGCADLLRVIAKHFRALADALPAEAPEGREMHADRLAKLQNLMRIQRDDCQDGGGYMRGLANGLILAESVMRDGGDEAPVFLDAPALAASPAEAPEGRIPTGAELKNWMRTPEGRKAMEDATARLQAGEQSVTIPFTAASPEAAAASEREVELPPMPSEYELWDRWGITVTTEGEEFVHWFAREHEKNVRAALAQSTHQAPEGETKDIADAIIAAYLEHYDLPSDQARGHLRDCIESEVEWQSPPLRQLLSECRPWVADPRLDRNELDARQRSETKHAHEDRLSSWIQENEDRRMLQAAIDAALASKENAE